MPIPEVPARDRIIPQMLLYQSHLGEWLTLRSYGIFTGIRVSSCFVCRQSVNSLKLKCTPRKGRAALEGKMTIPSYGEITIPWCNENLGSYLGLNIARDRSKRDL